MEFDTSIRNSDDPAASSGIQSAESGLRVLLALAHPGPPRMLKAIAEAAAMPPSKAHRYLASLVRLGFADRDPASGRYRLGPAALQLGLVALGNLDAVRIGGAALAALRDAIDETVALAVWGSHGATFVRVEEASATVTVHAKAGAVLPLLTSATGRVFGAFLPAAQTASFLGAARVEAEAIFAEVRRLGLGRVTGELVAGIHALSVPVLDHEGRIVAALTSLGAAGAFDSTPEGRVAQALHAAAARASAELGWRG